MFHMQCTVLGKSAGLMRPRRFSLSKKAAQRAAFFDSFIMSRRIDVLPDS